MPRTRVSLVVVIAIAFGGSAFAAVPEFNRDVRPILSENCYFCHGQDPAHREAKLRLDVREEAMRDLGGYAAIVPGKPDESELLKRLTTHDSDDKMPPVKSNRVVSPRQIDTIRRWIAAGASYQKHWAFETPRLPDLPAVKLADWPKNEIDRFILARLEAEGLSPSKEAPPAKWLRRASFDLTGLPAAPAEIDSFLEDVRARGEPAYASAVDRLLASERFGERQAAEWLDAARYADTHGFNNDSARSMWRWRDWVIDAFNANKRYDRFITEQLAGDLLPGATMDQRLATGFGRNHVINSEGGIIEEEYRVEYVADRVRTTSMAWMGLTMECSRCHDHKFDAMTQKDYYRLFAFFNNVAEHGEDGRVANAVPMMSAPTKPQAEMLAGQSGTLAELDKTLADARRKWKWNAESSRRIGELIATAKAGPTDVSFDFDGESVAPKPKRWSFPGKPPTQIPGVRGQAWASDGVGPIAKLEGDALVLNGKAGATVAFWVNPAPDVSADVALLSHLNHEGSTAAVGYGKGSELRLVAGELELRVSDRFPAYSMRVRSEGAAIKPERWQHVAVHFAVPDPELMRVPASVVRLFVNGVELPTRVLNDGLASIPGPQPWTLGADNAKAGAKFKGALDEWKTFPRALSAGEIRTIFNADALPLALSRGEAGKAAHELDWLQKALLSTDAETKEAFVRRDRVWEEHLTLRRELPTSMVMADMPERRQAHLLIRGNYDAPGEPVEPGALETLLVAWPQGAPRNRLGLAQWLTRADHPLTARVVVNRFWAQLFGTGIVKTLEDFGSQSEWPSHPELIDFLARDFIDTGWDTKAQFRKLVLSATYRQDSAVTPALVERDPENRLLARGPRVRLPAEAIRDQALAVAGLLRQRIGGPSVYPYQPDELYKSIVVGARYPGTTWPTSTGDDLYRRSLYTFWKRTSPHPAMLTFDVPDREFCQVRRSRTNTPLQALTLMNEPGMVESARELAARMLREGGADDASRVSFAFRLATGRPPRDAEVRVVTRVWQQFRDEFKRDAQGAADLLKVGVSKADAALPASELAATTMVAGMILNLDETVTKD